MRLKELRKQKHITQAELANHIGVVKSTICLYENKNRMPDIDTLIKLADYFNVTIDYLLGRNSFTPEEKAAGIGNHPANLSAAEWDWLELRSLILENHDEKYLNTLSELIRTLAEKSPNKS